MSTQEKIENRIRKLLAANIELGPFVNQLIAAISIAIAEEMDVLLDKFENSQVNTNWEKPVENDGLKKV